MELWQALLLGVVEGLTEFLPVSSTGHLLVVQRLLGIDAGAASNAYAICIQSGAVAAVLVLYVHRVRQMAAGLLGRNAAGARLLAALLVAFLPAAVVGLLFEEAIEQRLFGPWPVVAAWFAGGLAILFIGRDRDRGPRGAGPVLDLQQLDLRRALLIGLAQVLAMWPGTSRSLVTLLAGVLVGLSLPAAIEFSFLLGVLTLGAATLWSLLQQGDVMLASYGAASLLAGFLAAGVTAVIAVRWMLAYLARRDLRLFAWWRITAAAVVGGLLLAGLL